MIDSSWHLLNVLYKCIAVYWFWPSIPSSVFSGAAVQQNRICVRYEQKERPSVFARHSFSAAPHHSTMSVYDQLWCIWYVTKVEITSQFHPFCSLLPTISNFVATSKTRDPENSRIIDLTMIVTYKIKPCTKQYRTQLLNTTHHTLSHCVARSNHSLTVCNAYTQAHTHSYSNH